MPSAADNLATFRSMMAALGYHEAAASVALDKDANGRDVTVAWECRTCVRDCAERGNVQGCSEWMPLTEVPA